jgi:hypothetical protein
MGPCRFFVRRLPFCPSRHQMPSDGEIRQRPIVPYLPRVYGENDTGGANGRPATRRRYHAMRDDGKRDKAVAQKAIEKNMKQINREIELSLFFLKHGCPG